MSEQPSPFSDDMDEREPRPVGPVEQRRRTGPLWGALILIVLGVAMLLQNLGLDVPLLRNWWAFFILFPIFSAARRARSAYNGSGGRVTGAVVGPSVGALALFIVMLTLLFDLSWSLVLPIALILFGLGALASAVAASRR